MSQSLLGILGQCVPATSSVVTGSFGGLAQPASWRRAVLSG